MKPQIQRALDEKLRLNASARSTSERRVSSSRVGSPRVDSPRVGYAEDWDSLILSRGVLQTPDGPIPLRRIGAGVFAVAYREETPPGDVYVFTDDDTYDKEIAMMVHDDLPHNPHVPAVEKVGHTRDKTVWKMPFYEAPLRKAAGVSAWKTYKTLADCRDDACTGRYGKHCSGYQVNEQVVACAQHLVDDELVREALEGLKDWASNYSKHYMFEFSPKNLATDEKGNLVLLDVLFDEERFKAWREQNRRRR